MQYLEFRNQFGSYIAFSTHEIEKVFPRFNKINLLSWQKKKYIIKLRNNWYKFTEQTNDEHTLFYIANKIYTPSYISLETALSFHGLIPEGVFSINSVSALKTQCFKNQLATFNYSNIKASLFFGEQLIQHNDYCYKIADIEKAILDYFYLRNSIKTIDDIKALRLNKYILHEKLNVQKLFDYANIYESKILLKRINFLMQMLHD